MTSRLRTLRFLAAMGAELAARLDHQGENIHGDALLWDDAHAVMFALDVDGYGWLDDPETLVEGWSDVRMILAAMDEGEYWTMHLPADPVAPRAAVQAPAPVELSDWIGLPMVDA